MKLTYLQQPPKKWTFEQPRLKQWIEERCEGFTLNLFAGKTKLNIPEFRVDISNEFAPDIVDDAFVFVCKAIELKQDRYDTIILDPPYNIRKAREKYKGKWIGALTKIKNKLPEILMPKGIIFSLGYDSVGMSKSRRFEKEELCVVCHGGDHNDTLILKERKLPSLL